MGFSLTNRTNLSYTDADIQSLNFEALTLWFERFPQYKNREFWITGESYAGMYVPWLAKKILLSKEEAPYINLTGIMIANPVL